MTAVRFTHALTVDVEDWTDALGQEGVPAEHRGAESRVDFATRSLLELLASEGARATFFILGVVAERHPDLVRAIVAGGHRVGCHGWEHRVLHKSSPERFRTDLHRARAVLCDLSGQAVSGHRAPWFSLSRRTAWALDVLAEAGFTYDSSLFPCWNPLYGDSTASRHPHRTRSGLLEVPLAVAALGPLRVPVAGGFYWRLLPYGVLRWGLERLTKDGQPAVLYVHPWELDVEQPRIRMGFLSGLIHYTNRRGASGVLSRICRSWPLAPLEEVFPDSLRMAP